MSKDDNQSQMCVSSCTEGQHRSERASSLFLSAAFNLGPTLGFFVQFPLVNPKSDKSNHPLKSDWDFIPPYIIIGSYKLIQEYNNIYIFLKCTWNSHTGDFWAHSCWILPRTEFLTYSCDGDLHCLDWIFMLFHAGWKHLLSILHWWMKAYTMARWPCIHGNYSMCWECLTGGCIQHHLHIFSYSFSK